ncbi:hypothetical protein FRC01_004926 [Tulasnella sp. 417]|nr:hypothetical protein FRC01_004926 [Tulasnella sp. 417]
MAGTKRAVAVAIAAYLYYRKHDIYFQVVPPTLPPQWFAYGDASTACSIINGGNSPDSAGSGSGSDPQAVLSAASSNPDFRFCEDMVQWDLVAADGRTKQSGGVRHLIVGCDPGRMSWNPVMGPLRDPWAAQGSLWLYSYSSGSSRGVPRKLELKGFPKTSVFHPFGIDIIYDPKTEQYRLLATNQGVKASYVEVFTLSPPPSSSLDSGQGAAVVEATYVKTLSHPGIVSPNSLAVISPNSFYLTNDHTLTRRIPYVGTFAHVFETFAKFPGGWVDVVEFDDDSEQVRVKRAIDHKIPFANGIAMSPNGQTVTVASSTDNSVSFYRRNATTNFLTYDSRVEVPFHTDNLAYDTQDGTTLYASGHPFYPDLIKVVKGKKLYSSSWLVAVSPRAPTNTKDERYQEEREGGGTGKVGSHGPFIDQGAPVPSHLRAAVHPEWEVRSIWQSDGSRYSASATGFVDREGGKVFVAGLYEPRGLLQCE